MKRPIHFFLLPALVLLLVGCEQEGRGFSLPEGSAEAGEATFHELGCISCHSVRGEEAADVTRTLHVVLGGATPRVRTYGELVTSIINPSHRIARASTGSAVDDAGQSRMRIYNEFMTVQQLVDLVTYLQTKYDVVVPRTPYMPFP